MPRSIRESLESQLLSGLVLRLLAHRLAGVNLRRRQYRKLQAHDVAEIPAHGGPGARGGDLAVRWIRAEQRLQWRLPIRGGRRYSEPRQRRALVRRNL